MCAHLDTVLYSSRLPRIAEEEEEVDSPIMYDMSTGAKRKDKYYILGIAPRWTKEII